MYLRSLFRQYELFCLANSLDIQTSRASIQRHLVRKSKVSIAQLNVQRLRGIKWIRDEWNCYTPMPAVQGGHRQTAGHPHTVQPQMASQLQTTAQPLHGRNRRSTVLQKALASFAVFIEEECVVTKDPNDFIDIKTRSAPPDGNLKLGLHDALRLWGQQKGETVLQNTLELDSWLEVLPMGVVFKRNQTVRQVYGIQLKDGSMHDMMGVTSLWAIDTIAMFVQLLIIVGP